MPAIALTALAFAAGLAAGLASLPAAALLAPGAAVLAALLLRRSPGAVVALAALGAGAVWGMASRVAHERDCRVRWRTGERLTLVLEHRSLPAPARLQDMRLADGPCGGSIAVLWPSAAAAAAPGRYIIGGRWQRELDPAARRWRRPERLGRFIAREVRPAGPVRCPSAGCLRIGAEARLARLFGSRGALAAALTVDADAPLPRAARDLFNRAGLAHLLSISGFHVALIAASLLVLLRALGIAPAPAAAGAALLAALYVLFLGAPAPALRAALALALWTWSKRRQRPTPPSALIAVCALAVMVADPFALFEAGAWLSFAGVWGCVAAARLWRQVVSETSRPRRARVRWLLPVAVSIGATLATAPVTMLAFGSATPVAIVSNVAAVPLASFAVPAIALALACSLLPVALPAEVAAAAADVALRLLERTAELAGRLPGGTIPLGDLAPAVALALAAWLILRAPPPRLRRPVRRMLVARTVLAGLLLAATAQSAALAAPRASDAQGRLALHFLAVGQGDATVIRTPNGRWILIDGGPRAGGMDAGARRVVPFLKRHGVRRLSLVVASHGDADHLGGLPAVLRAVPADVVLEPGEPLGRALYRRWLAQAARTGARWHAARAGERFVIDGVTIRIWHPDSAWMARGEAANENSLVLTVEHGAFRALFPGDAGLPMEGTRAAAIGDVTLLKVGHHGSRSATGPAWLDAIRPELCIIPVGVNRYGHPHPSVLGALRGAGCRIMRTDIDGDIRVSADGVAPMVVEERE